MDEEDIEFCSLERCKVCDHKTLPYDDIKEAYDKLDIYSDVLDDSIDLIVKNLEKGYMPYPCEIMNEIKNKYKDKGISDKELLFFVLLSIIQVAEYVIVTEEVAKAFVQMSLLHLLKAK